MTHNKLPGDTLNDVAARLAAADLVRREVQRLEKIILQMEQGALYYANTEFGPASGAQMIELCKGMLRAESVQALAAPLYAASVGRGLDVGIAGSPAARPQPPYRPAPYGSGPSYYIPEEPEPEAPESPEDISPFSSAASIIAM